MKTRISQFIRRLFGIQKLIQVSKKQNYNTIYSIRRFQLINSILYNKEKGITYEQYTDHDIIVSLTTHGKRINDVAVTIESIMQQSMKANRIVLWLDESFEKRILPQFLVKQRTRGLEIAYCKDVRSYTKLVPALRRYPNDAIITIDDDALYDPDLLERLIIPYLDNPNYIYCHRFHKMTFAKNGELLPYRQWQWSCKDKEPSHLNFFTGVGGVLYPPHSLDSEVTNETVFLNICEYADDVWFNAMAIKNGTKVKKVYTRTDKCEEFLLNQNVQDIGLLHINTKGEMLNDKQIKAVFTRYNLYNKLK